MDKWEDRFDEKLLDKLADIEHQRWADWQKYFHSKCSKDSDGNSVIPKGYVDALNKLIETDYCKLTEDQKENDKREVGRYKGLLLQFIRDEVKEERKKAVEEYDSKIFGRPIFVMQNEMSQVMELRKKALKEMGIE